MREKLDDLALKKRSNSLESFVSRTAARINHLKTINTEIARQVSENNKEVEELESEHELLCSIINQMREAREDDGV